MKEWDFKEESEDVDIERIFLELSGVPTVHGKMYLSELEKKAPIVYGRYKQFIDKIKGESVV